MLLFSFTGNLCAEQAKTILMLVTSADKMANDKATGLWLEEFAVPYQAFVAAGYKVEVVSPKGGAVPVDPRSQAKPEQAKQWEAAIKLLEKSKTLDQVNADDYAAVFISGGHGVMFDLVDNPAASKLISAFDAKAKPVAAVCHGSAALVKVVRADNTPLVKGKKMAPFTDAEERAVELDKDMPFLLESKLRELGAIIESKENFSAHALRDGNLISGQNPASSQLTAKLLLEALAESNK